ncbi:hypothetical protein D3C71_1856570 [compost metagenome]
MFQLRRALRRNQATHIFEQCQSGALTGHFRRVRTHDTGAVARQINLGDTAAARTVTLGQPGAIERVPGELTAEQIGQLGFTAQAVSEGHRVAVE